MKATGIVRRIDDLGRVVIPKEIRRTLRIREGDPLEIYTEKDGEVIFKKYSPMGDLGEFAGQICEAIGKNTGYIAAVCDRDAIIAVHGVSFWTSAARRSWSSSWSCGAATAIRTVICPSGRRTHPTATASAPQPPL